MKNTSAGGAGQTLRSGSDLLLGPTDNLRAMRIKGVRNATRSLNPIVRLVQGRQGAHSELCFVAPDIIRATLANGVNVEILVPAAIRSFLHNFNGGGYPDLEAPFDPAADNPHSYAGQF